MSERTPTVAGMLASPPPVQPVAPAPARPGWPGAVSLVVGLLAAGGVAAGIILATSDQFLIATYVAWAAIGASGLAVLSGLVAIIGRFGRGWGTAGVVLGVVANPYLLTIALEKIGGLWA